VVDAGYYLVEYARTLTDQDRSVSHES
jgi:hypothetical protein